MVFQPPTFGTPITDPGQERFKKGLEEAQAERDEEDRKQCLRFGGKWDKKTRTCIGAIGFEPVPDPTQIKLPEEPKEEPKKIKPQPGEIITDAETGEPKGFINSAGEFVAASRADIENVVRKRAARLAPIEGAQVFEERRQREEALARGEQLAGQIGQFGQLGIAPTGLDVKEAATEAAISSIPSAIRLGATAGLGIGALGGTAVFPGVGTAVGATAGAAIGAGAGFIAGIVGGMTSNFKSQRRDTTTAQQRVLDEGKQTLQDWVTLARSDPANKAFYLAQYNKQLAQIDQAHRQMKLDTSRDLAKFETALPNLAEFDSFYSVGGERDALNEEMRNALLTISPENYNMLELAHRIQQQ